MTNRQPSFWRHFTLAYEDAFRVLPRMWPALLPVVAAEVVMELLGDMADGFIGTKLGHGVLALLVSAATAWIVAPYAIALYRAVATGEITGRPETMRSNPATQRFAAWSVLMAFVVYVPYILFTMAGLDVTPEQINDADLNPGIVLPIFVLMLVMWIFVVRATTLMPLLALDPNHASLPAALGQSKGHFWLIVGLSLVTTLPVLVGGVIVSSLITSLFGPLAPIILVPVEAAITGATVLVAIALTTRLYQRFVVA